MRLEKFKKVVVNNLQQEKDKIGHCKIPFKEIARKPRIIAFGWDKKTNQHYQNRRCHGVAKNHRIEPKPKPYCLQPISFYARQFVKIAKRDYQYNPECHKNENTYQINLEKVNQ
jgi:hypothetical protein